MADYADAERKAKGQQRDKKRLGAMCPISNGEIAVERLVRADLSAMIGKSAVHLC